MTSGLGGWDINAGFQNYLRSIFYIYIYYTFTELILLSKSSIEDLSQSQAPISIDATVKDPSPKSTVQQKMDNWFNIQEISTFSFRRMIENEMTDESREENLFARLSTSRRSMNFLPQKKKRRKKREVRRSY